MWKVIILFGFSLLLSACRQEACEKEHTDEINVLVSDGCDGTALLGDVFETVETIQLESSTESMITHIKRLIPFKEKYFILDNKEQKCILVFDHKGKFIRKIGKVGHGRGEYITVEDFCIDKENERIVILSNNSTVYAYKLDGEFLFKKELDKSILWSIASNSQGFLLSSNHLTYTSGENAFLFYRFDKDFNLIKKSHPVLPKQMYAVSGISANPCTLKDKFVYTDLYRHKVFRFDQEGDIESCYELQFSHQMPYIKFHDTNVFMKEQQKYDYLLDNILFDDKFIFFFVQKGKVHIAASDLSGKILQNKEFLGPIPKLLYSDERHIFSAHSPEDIRWMAEAGLLSSKDIPSKTENNYMIVKLKPICTK